MAVSWSTPSRRAGLDRGCGCGLKQHDGQLAAQIALDKAVRLALPGSEPERLRLMECRRRPGVWHLVMTAPEAITPEVRRLVLKRDGYRCVCCGVSVIGRRYSIGHRVRRGQGGSDLPSNLITVLGLGGEMCHGRIDNRADPHDEPKGYALFSWQDPAETGVMYFESPDGPGVTYWLTDDGRRLTEPERSAA